jgi:hypothetical protein
LTSLEGQKRRRKYMRSQLYQSGIRDWYLNARHYSWLFETLGGKSKRRFIADKRRILGSWKCTTTNSSLNSILQPGKVYVNVFYQNTHITFIRRKRLPITDPFFPFFVVSRPFLTHHFWIYRVLISLDVLMVDLVLHAWFTI